MLTILYRHVRLSVLCEYAIAAYFTYCLIFCIFKQSVHGMRHIFPHKLAFLMAIFIFFVFLLPTSATYLVLYGLHIFQKM